MYLKKCTCYTLLVVEIAAEKYRTKNKEDILA